MHYKVFLFQYFKLNFIVFFILFIGVYFIFDKYPKNDLDSKEYLIKDYQPLIVFAGDSRAERQLNVNYATHKLKLSKGDIINIGISSGNVIMINNLIDKFPDKFKQTKMIISISANQLNDNALDIGIFDNALISRLNLYEQIEVFFPFKVNTLINYYFLNYKELIMKKLEYSSFNNDYESTLGFNPIDKSLDVKNMKISTVKRNPWYIKYKDGGLKYKILKNELKKLKSRVDKIYLYTAPFAHSYLELIKDDILYVNEQSFKNKISEICLELDINCKNYMKLSELNDKHFYDLSHLNVSGSKIFTEKIINDFQLNKSEVIEVDK